MLRLWVNYFENALVDWLSYDGGFPWGHFLSQFRLGTCFNWWRSFDCCGLVRYVLLAAIEVVYAELVTDSIGQGAALIGIQGDRHCSVRRLYVGVVRWKIPTSPKRREQWGTHLWTVSD